MLEVLHLMNRYSRWMNGKLLAECSKLTDEERKEDRRAPFRSIHGLWNHVLVADRIWLSRFGIEPFSATSLDQELFSDWHELVAARTATDDNLDIWLRTLSAETLAGDLTFTMMVKPETVTLSYSLTALHVFNHGTHHRGQITALLEQAGGDCGVTDLLRVP